MKQTHVARFSLVGCGLLLAVVSLFLPLGAQTTAPDPAKVEQLRQRFEQGYALQKEHKYVEARAIYDGILAEAPEARRSLLEAGRVSMLLGEFTKASVYLENLHTLEPDYPDALEMLIQTNQALNRDVKVENYRRKFKALHESGKIPEFSTSPLFIRERIQLPKSLIVVSEFFNYNQPPYTVWRAVEVDNTTQAVLHWVSLTYDPEATKQVRAKDPRLATVEEFLLLDKIIKGDRIKGVNIFDQEFTLIDYSKFRKLLLSIVSTTPPKPIYSSSDLDAPLPNILDPKAP